MDINQSEVDLADEQPNRAALELSITTTLAKILLLREERYLLSYLVQDYITSADQVLTTDND